MPNLSLDLHTHILPNMDDGPDTVTMSKNMLKKFAEDGINHIILTSHFYTMEEEVNEFCKRRQYSYELILDEIEKRGLNTYLGAEVYLTKYLFRQKNLEKVLLGNTRSILLELEYTEYHDLNQIANWISLLKNENIEILIAHPERYRDCLDKYFIKDLTDMDCQFVISGYDMNGYYQKNLERFLKIGNMHFIASDCHSDCGNRAPKLLDYYEKAKKLICETELENLHLNSERLLSKLKVGN